jgi:hypothetical protein
VLVLAALLGITALAIAQENKSKPQNPTNGPATGSAGAAPVDTLAGTYQGTAKGDPSGDIPLTLALQNQAGKLSGQITTPEAVMQLAEGAFKDGRLTLKFTRDGHELNIAGQVKNDSIVGVWTLAGKTGPVELKKVTAAAAKPADPVTTAANGDAFSGEWDAVADVNGESFPFTLTLKINGENVAGGSSSQLGTATIGTGTCKEGRVTFRLDGSSGPIAMTAIIQEGKLVGDFDFNGEMQGRWVAVKRKP